MRKSFSYWLAVTLMIVVASTIAYAQLSYTPPSFAPKQVIPSATFNTLFNTIDQEALNRTGGTMTGNLIWSPDGTGSIGAPGATRPADIHVQDDVFIGDALSVTGASTLAAVGATNGTFSGTLGVTGATTLAAVSATSGTFSSTLGVSGATTLAALSATTGAFSSTLAVTGAATFSTAPTISSTQPFLRMTETDASANEQRWWWVSVGGTATFQAVNDAEGAAGVAWTVTRSAHTPQLTTFSTALALPSAISPAALASGNTNDYTPTGLGAAFMLRLTADAGGSTVTGIAAQPAGTWKGICNIAASGGITFPAEDANSSAANRFANAGAVGAGGCVRIWYDGTSARWRFL